METTAERKKSKQVKHYFTQMAGEFFVAGELFRNGYFANVSFGNAKSFDIIVSSRNEDRFARIEVKTSSGSYFTRKKVPVYEDDQKFLFNIKALHNEIKVQKGDSNKFYAFVCINGHNGKPDFYVFPARKVYEIMSKKIGSQPEEKVHGPWDIKLSELFDGQKQKEIEYRKSDCWYSLNEYLEQKK